MGGFCCCPCPEDFEEYAHPNNPIYRHCICLRYFFHQLFSGYNATFQRLDGRTATSPTQTVTSLTSTALGANTADSSVSETYHLVPRPPPYDTEPRYTRSQREGLVLRREKSLSYIQEESQAPRRNGSNSGLEHLGSAKKRNSTETEEETKAGHSESDTGLSSKAYGIASYVVTNSEDEDVCPTCLEEYTPENPKIVAKCSHHFHLSCIYEWMERSDNCPICGKEMEFCESP
ncbi:E3 ubiquitin-protein ligase At3g02290-like [Ananas comosus]|uniref:RING-type E3 ubiquitin transferase n=1 Tax=Ananas comosus TaxID=4615 RepID=A0A199VR91_ANACO|nr:E3 ubiquitin-protein ligase At3g02290-like [Ananas comosus]XP_020091876.1 E3 ubiquitin-protein ligase At3g02290-like [Ananas comosus]OAY79528.1 E3 ubiquitin-protein ligase [Ananas comosus]